jgi:hypothetical protein
MAGERSAGGNGQVTAAADGGQASRMRTSVELRDAVADSARPDFTAFREVDPPQVVVGKRKSRARNVATWWSWTIPPECRITDIFSSPPVAEIRGDRWVLR